MIWGEGKSRGDRKTLVRCHSVPVVPYGLLVGHLSVFLHPFCITSLTDFCQHQEREGSQMEA
jgi:hypothetical protein